MDKSILVISTPKSCSECKLHTFQVCQLGLMNNQELYVSGYTKSRHPQCPLQDTTELLETVEDLVFCNKSLVFSERVAYNKLYKALGGSDE